ncbi:C-X-C motif chemokine 6 [Galemys pyrenaicus]|uniref:C-X-C motif chemokine n=1 Tax=Galemys pyrenaicus TaxID=202257 RepID=A0A8J6DNV1_GALPY|nr:C-X-C motif chemokine 6 [Galemys pyrenaicus]
MNVDKKDAEDLGNPVLWSFQSSRFLLPAQASPSFLAAMSLQSNLAVLVPHLSGSLCVLLALQLLTTPGPVASGKSAQHAARTSAERRSSRAQPGLLGGGWGKSSPRNLPYNVVAPSIPAGPVAANVRELRCICLSTTPGIHPKMINNLQVIAAGPQCPRVEVVATVKNRKGQLCLDPEAPLIKKVIQKILERASPFPLLQMLLLLSLLLTTLVPSTMGETNSVVDYDLYLELRCLCIKTTSVIHPNKIQKLEVIRAGPHCARIEVM